MDGTLNDNVFTFIDLCKNDGTSTIMFLNSTKNVYINVWFRECKILEK